MEPNANCSKQFIFNLKEKFKKCEIHLIDYNKYANELGLEDNNVDDGSNYSSPIKEPFLEDNINKILKHEHDETKKITNAFKILLLNKDNAPGYKQRLIKLATYAIDFSAFINCVQEIFVFPVNQLSYDWQTSTTVLSQTSTTLILQTSTTPGYILPR